MQHVFLVAERARHRRHRFGHLVRRVPHRVLNVLLEDHVVLFLLLDVIVLRASAVVPTKSLVEPHVRRVRILPNAKLSFELSFRFLFRECSSGAESQDVGVEGAVLPDDMVEWLILEQDFAVEFRILFSRQVLLAFIRFFRVANFI